MLVNLQPFQVFAFKKNRHITAWSRMTESVGNNENLSDFGTTVI
jgi:hypothetical protein